ncbi:MAG: MFS transporter [Nocardioides sp.]
MFWSYIASGSLADGMTLIALTWVAASTTDNALLVAAVGTAERLPWLLLSLHLGALVDRLPRLAVLAGSGAARSATMLGLVTLLLLGDVSIWTLMPFAFALGVTEVLAGVAGETAVPLLVPSSQLARANGHVRSAEILANDFLGRPIGGVLLQVAFWIPFLGNAITTGLGVLLVMKLRKSVGDPWPKQLSDEQGSRQALAGMRWIRESPILKNLILSALLINSLFGALIGTQVLLVKRTLELNAFGYSILLAVSAVGGILGGQVAAKLADLVGVKLPLLGSLGVMGICFLGIASFPRPVPVMILYGIVSAAVAIWSVTALCLRQTQVPNEFLGRVNSSFRMVTFGVSALGMIGGGYAVELLSSSMPLGQALVVPYFATGILYSALTVILAIRFRNIVFSN